MMDTIRPVTVRLLRDVTDRARKAGIPERHLLTRRAKVAAMLAWMAGASHARSLDAARDVLGGLPLPAGGGL